MATPIRPRLSIKAPLPKPPGPPGPPGVKTATIAYDVVLVDPGPGKLNVVKVVKTVTGLGLKESKDLVDAAPCVVKSAISKEEAEAIKAHLVEAGATVQIRIHGQPAPPPVPAPAPAPEAVDYEVVLVDFGAGKLNVVKVVKTVTGLGLKEAKDLVDAAPCVVRTGISQEEAEAIKAQLVEAGATVKVRKIGAPLEEPPAPTPGAVDHEVVLVDAGAGKLNVVKVVKTVTGLGLKESKDLVDAAPCVVRTGISQEEAEAIKAQLVEAGATVKVRKIGAPLEEPPAPTPGAVDHEVVLVDAGAGKLNVVKVVKTVTGLGLKESKDLVDAAPCVVRTGISQEEAEAIKAQLVEAGATVQVRKIGAPVEPPAPPPTPEAADYAVVLIAAGPGKLNVVKVVKTVTGLGLKESKDLVEAAPGPVKSGISQEEAEAIKAMLVEAGATVEIRRG